MLGLADDTVDEVVFAVEPDPPTAITARPIGPYQALIAIEWDGGVFQKGERLAIKSPTAERITMDAPSFVMRAAPSSSARGLATAIY